MPVSSNLRRSIEAQLSQTIVAFVANGAGVALIDPVTAAYAGQRVAVKPFEPAVPDHFYLVTSASQPLSMIGEAFCANLRDAFATMRGKGAGESARRGM